MQDLRKKIKAKKLLQNWIWDGLGLNLGGLWDDLGRLLAPFGRLWVVTWPFRIEFLEALVQDCPQEAFGIDLGSILDGFWKDFDRVWEGFGESLGKA